MVCKRCGGERFLDHVVPHIYRDTLYRTCADCEWAVSLTFGRSLRLEKESAKATARHNTALTQNS